MNKPDLIPLTKRIHIVNTPTNGKFPFGFSFLVLGDDVRALIDTGCGPEACNAVMEEYGIDVVVNSHCHPDHISCNHLFQGRELWVPEERKDEVGTLERLSMRLMGPDPELPAFWRRWVGGFLGLSDYEPTGSFRDGDVLDFGGVRLAAIHTPGHLDDHYCFLEPVENILFSFDVDLTGIGPFYGNPEADIDRFKASIHRIMDMAPRVVASSHRLPVSENLREELASYMAKFDRNEERVAKVLDAPRTLEEIVEQKPIFGKYLPDMERIYAFFEGHMVKKHLECMEKEGRVEKTDGRYCLA
ncbi:MAG: MBL fold metallo-hydrolase [Desulfatibacillaceae bacterium]